MEDGRECNVKHCNAILDLLSSILQIHRTLPPTYTSVVVAQLVLLPNPSDQLEKWISDARVAQGKPILTTPATFWTSMWIRAPFGMCG